MDYLLAGMVLFIGTAGLMLMYARSFKRPALQIFFYALSFLMIIAGFVFQLAAPGITYHSDTIAYADLNMTNVTSYYSVPAGTAGIINGMYTNVLFGFLLIMAIIMVLFLLDSVLLFIGKKSEEL